jgi:hypothetical protein
MSFRVSEKDSPLLIAAREFVAASVAARETERDQMAALRYQLARNDLVMAARKEPIMRQVPA